MQHAEERKKDKEKEKESKSKARAVLPPTEGIEVSQLMADDGALTLNVWDFAGGSSYQSTHTFFFTTNTLYVLVANPTEEGFALKLEYWLSLLSARAGKSPVMIVGTRLDEVTKEQLKAFIEQTEALKGVYKTVCAVACVSSVTQKGIKVRTRSRLTI